MTNASNTANSSSGDAKSWSAARSPLVPHVAFWAVGVLVKIIFPGALKWLAQDNITTLLLSVWYPLCATISLIHRDKGRQQLQAFDSLQMERQFWIEYWSIGFAGVQFIHRFISLVPSLRQMGRHEYPQLPTILSEVKLLYFLWLFVMETLLARYQRLLGVDEQKAHWKKYVPLTFLTKAVGPRLMRVQMTVSEQISKETWQKYIKRKMQRIFELLVMLQFIEVESMHYMLQLVEEGRSLFLLSVFMVLPSSICEIGTLYPQLIYPSARSLVVRGEAVEIFSLKYWVLNNILSLFFSATWWLWWCIPFSNQILLGIRCFATFPTIITIYYQMLEMDLITFGILSGQAELTVKETKTVQALRALVKRLPRDKHAQSFQFEIDEPIREYKAVDDDSSIGSEDTTESEEERRRKRRREKRAKKKLLKQKKSSGSSLNSNGTRPSPNASEEENERTVRHRDNFSDEGDGNYSSFINENESKSKATGDVRLSNTMVDYDMVKPPPTEAKKYSHCGTEHNKQKKKSTANRENISSIEKEQRDARNAAAKDAASQLEIRHATSFTAQNDGSENDRSNDLTTNDEDNDDRALLPSTTIGSNYSSSQLQLDSKVTSLSIATPTESVVGEVEVRVKGASGHSKATTKRTSAMTALFPATHPTLAGSGSAIPLSSSEEISSKVSITSLNVLSFKSQSQVSDNDTYEGADSGLCLSDIDTTASSTVGSFEVWSPASNTDKMTSLKEQSEHEDDTTPHRRSSRLVQLREWQKKKRQEEELELKKKQKLFATKPSSTKQTKKTKISTKKKSTDIQSIEKSSTEQLPDESKKTAPKSKSERKEKSSVSSTKRTSKKSKTKSPERDSVITRSAATSIAKRVKKKSSAASPDKSSSKQKGEAPPRDNVDLGDSTNSSPGKISRKKSKKTPNSKRKKSSVFGSVLGRK